MSIATRKNHLKLLITLLVIFIVAPIAVIYFGVLRHQHSVDPKNIKIDGSYLVPAKEIQAFALKDNQGNAFTLNNLKGHWSLMFFGFTNCGMVCPTTLSALNKMYQTLQRELPDKQLPQIIMVTVDPERDTQTKMKSYLTAFNSHFMGLHGSMSATTHLEKQLHIVAVKIQGETKDKNDYYYDHSAEILVINPEGKVQAYLSYPHNAETLVKEYKLMRSIG